MRPCNGCQEVSESPELLAAHFLDKHVTMMKRCKTCHESFTSMVDLDKHLREAHGDEGLHERLIRGENASTKESTRGQQYYVLYNCELCEGDGSWMTSLLVLRKHMVLGHTKAKCRCKTCGKLFENHLKSEQHNNWTHKKANMETRCPVCKKRLSVRRNLRMLRAHLTKVHKVENPEKLIQPKRRRMDNSRIKTDMIAIDKEHFQCKFCKETIKRVAGARRHLESQHPIDEDGQAVTTKPNPKNTNEPLEVRRVTRFVLLSQNEPDHFFPRLISMFSSQRKSRWSKCSTGNATSAIRRFVIGKSPTAIYKGKKVIEPTCLSE